MKRLLLSTLLLLVSCAAPAATTAVAESDVVDAVDVDTAVDAAADAQDIAPKPDVAPADAADAIDAADVPDAPDSVDAPDAADAGSDAAEPDVPADVADVPAPEDASGTTEDVADDASDDAVVDVVAADVAEDVAAVDAAPDVVTCTTSNGGVETCDGADNDCNGVIDDVDFTAPSHCGTCANNCFDTLPNTDPATVTCTWSGQSGVAGQCAGKCVTNYWNAFGSATGCPYYCVASGLSDTTCDGRDDDCDGATDEDVDLCTDTANCGACGHACQLPHASAKCLTAPPLACDASATCAIGACDIGWWDLDGLTNNGCEYPCTLTNGGVETCDGIDNNCNGSIDGAVEFQFSADIGVTCTGGATGLCAEPSHFGTSVCAGGKVICVGANVLVPNTLPETCNGVDDDCNGSVDDAVSDAGASCGASAIPPCHLGKLQCIDGSLQCSGAIDPAAEVCNGADDNCDGATDNDVAGLGGACSVPSAAPAGATSACSAGTLACEAGNLLCSGAKGPTSVIDSCGLDANCDGVLTQQPDLINDVHNCGVCGKDCNGYNPHGLWSCVGGTCNMGGCASGYYSLPGQTACTYACTFTSAQELCNGVDDNCDGQTDENLVAPSPAQACGVSPNAASPECTTNVVVKCVAGAWQCVFPTSVCAPNCASASEICDGLDNNCNGLVNENVANYGQPCHSDDGAPSPGDGACRTQGVYVCNGTAATKCSAVKADCATLAGGCTEKCDGIDNDCDGTIDEPFSAKGSKSAYFVAPAVVKVGPSVYMDAYEVSRVGATATTGGVGNGFATSAPVATTLDKTTGCSRDNRLPWLGLSGAEAAQVCSARGGALCSLAQWQAACAASTGTCLWGYNPAGAACTSKAVTGPSNAKFCNMAATFDIDSATAGVQSGPLAAAASVLSACSADMSGVFGNATGSDQLFDMTGNAREIVTLSGSTYAVAGGSWLNESEFGGACTAYFTLQSNSTALYDAGFRCCYTADPRL